MQRDTFIKIRATAGERQLYMEAATRRGADLSKIVRAHLDRLVKRDAKAASQIEAAE